MNERTVTLENPTESIKAWEFPATIGSCAYRVTVPKLYWQKLTGGTLAARELVFRSLLFLLAREPAERIAPEFSLDEIPAYFPDYEAHIQENL